MKRFLLSEVELTEPAFEAAWRADVAFIKKLEPDRLLSGFRRSAGLSDKGVKPYGGWENSRIGGHTIGHWMKACAQEIAAHDDRELEQRVIYVVEELRKCQEQHGNGFLFGARLDEGEEPERQFDIEEGKIRPKEAGLTWVPWYTMHKIMDGLLSVFRLCGNETALSVAEHLGDWIYERVNAWDTSARNEVLQKEYGGMSECLYELWHQTGREKYREAAEVFNDIELMRKLAGRKSDTLNGRHANTTIPKFLGAMENQSNLADMFWTRVTERHTYETGGISDMEHFHEDYGLDGRRTQCNCEGCCAHNMLKLSQRLYEKKAENKYAAYEEQLLFNAILGAMNPKDGTTAYFSPMATGYRKTFGRANPDYNKFWCCTGTGMENYTKLQEEIFCVDGEEVYLNQYIGAKLRQDAYVLSLQMDWKDGVRAEIEYQGEKSFLSLRLRVPVWAEKNPVVKVKGGRKEIKQNANDIRIMGMWEKGDGIQIFFGAKVQAHVLPDNKKAVCFTYGPYVLAAKLGREHWTEETEAGIDVVADAWKVVGKEEKRLSITYGETNCHILPGEILHRANRGESRETFLNKANQYMKCIDGEELRFELTGTDAEEQIGMPMIFVPYYQITDERYGIYWYIE